MYMNACTDSRKTLAMWMNWKKKKTIPGQIPEHTGLFCTEGTVS